MPAWGARPAWLLKERPHVGHWVCGGRGSLRKTGLRGRDPPVSPGPWAELGAMLTRACRSPSARRQQGCVWRGSFYRGCWGGRGAFCPRLLRLRWPLWGQRGHHGAQTVRIQVLGASCRDSGPVSRTGGFGAGNSGACVPGGSCALETNCHSSGSLGFVGAHLSYFGRGRGLGKALCAA